MSGLPPDHSAHVGGLTQIRPPYIQYVAASGYTVPVSKPIVEAGMTTIDERVSKLDTSVAVQGQEIKGLATKADLERMVNDLKTFVTNELSPMKADIGNVKVDIASIKTEITHHATKAWVYATLAVASIGALGAIGSIFTVLNVAPKH